MKKFILFILTLVVSFSCQKGKEEIIKNVDNSITSTLTNEEIKSLLRLKDNHSISLEEANMQALSVAAIFDQSKSELKSSISTRGIANARTIWYKIRSGLKSSNGSNDSLALYVFNYSNGQQDSLGYALISGDDRLPSVLSCSNSGVLYDTVSNPGVGIFLSHIPDYIDRKIKEESSISDSIYNQAITKLNNELPDSLKVPNSNLKSSFFLTWKIENYSVGGWQAITQYGPFEIVTWDQGWPYNTSLSPINCNGTYRQPWTGCVATAIAQIMAYHRHPSNIQGNNFNWAEMVAWPNAWQLSTNGRSQVATLMRLIGQGVSMSYGCDGSVSNIDNANSWYNNNGYNTGGVQGYNLSTIISSLSSNRPVQIRGCAIKTTTTYGWWIFSYTNTTYSEGHAWVIDGYVKRQRKISYNLVLYSGSRKITSQPVSYYQYDEYVRCNYGWGGLDNGYYLSGVFDTNAGSTTLKSGTPGYYQYDMKILPNIRPK
jgi:hypothetical protein